MPHTDHRRLRSLRAAAAVALIAACAQPALGAARRAPAHRRSRAPTPASSAARPPRPAAGRSWRSSPTSAAAPRARARSSHRCSCSPPRTARRTSPTGTLTPASDLRVVTGQLDWTQTASGQVLDVAQVVIDPTFDATTLDDDAALLVLASPTQAPAIALAGPAESSLLAAGTPAQLAGWGYTLCRRDDPADRALPGPRPSCRARPTARSRRRSTASSTTRPRTSARSMTRASRVAACHGDSGGPLVATAAGGTPVEIGITSHGDPNCNPSYPSVFTRADAVSGLGRAVDRRRRRRRRARPPAAAAATSPTTHAHRRRPPASAAPRRGTRAAPDDGGAPRAPGAFDGSTAPARRAARADARRRPPQRDHDRLHAALRAPHAPAPARDVERRGGGHLRARAPGSFSDAFTDQRGWRYTLPGSFSSPTRVAGTLSVRTRNGACTAHAVRWTARPPSAVRHPSSRR